MRARREVTRTNGNFQSKPVVGHSDIYWVASLYSFARGATTSANRSNSASRFTCNPPEPTSFLARPITPIPSPGRSQSPGNQHPAPRVFGSNEKYLTLLD